MRNMEESNPKRSCPCKRIPLCLSSFTAAEYGDVHTLSKKAVDVNRTDTGGYTALHLAAQNGHAAATAWLLKTGGALVDGGTDSGSTPLHRSSFSGAVVTMKLLLEANADLLAKDSSFGDLMTPLHKATAGGRYLAVHLLLETLEERNVLSAGLTATDSRGRTALAVAQEIIRVNQEKEEEDQSGKRWDVIAGGPPDWGKCVTLLYAKEEKIKRENLTPAAQTTAFSCVPVNNNNNNRTIITSSSPTTATTTPTNSRFFNLGQVTSFACFNGCENDDNGRCATVLWESKFRSILSSSAQCTIIAKDDKTTPTGLPKDRKNKDSSSKVIIPSVAPSSAFGINKEEKDKQNLAYNNKKSIIKVEESPKPSYDIQSKEISSGANKKDIKSVSPGERSCDICGVKCISFFRMKNKKLGISCKSCHYKAKRGGFRRRNM